MVKVVEMDEKVILNTQLEEDVGAVILLNKFTVNPEDVDQFLKVFAATTEVLKLNLDSSRLSCIGILLAVVRS